MTATSHTRSPSGHYSDTARLRIFILISSLTYGGAERQLVTLAREFTARGHEVHVAAYYGGPLAQYINSLGIPLHLLGKRGRWDLMFLIRLGSVLRRINPQVLLTYLSGPNVLSILLRLLIPGMRVVWGIRASNVKLAYYHWTTRLTYALEKWFSRYADLILVNSHAGLEHAARGGFRVERMCIVPNGIDTNIFRPDKEMRIQARKEWEVSDNETLIGLVGRLDPMKDHQTFLRACALLVQRLPHLRFVCIGEGPQAYQRMLKDQAQALNLTDYLIWSGTRLNMAPVYNGLDILCLTSAFGEGFPNVVGEAMACGVPCVVTDVGDAARIVGPTGEVVALRDPKALYAAISRMLIRIERDSSLKLQTRARIVDNFKLELLTRRMEQLLQGLLHF